MTKQEQIEEIAKYICNVCEMGHGFNGDCSEGGTDHYKHCTLTQETAEALYEEGYRKVPDGAVVLTPEERGDEMKATNEVLEERDNLLARVGVLGREVEELKAKLKECDIADDYTIGFATYSAQKQHKEVDKIKTDNEQIKEIEEVLINKSKYTGKDCTDCDHWFGSFCGAPIKCQAEAIYEAGYRKSPDKKIVFIDVSEPKKERIIPEGEPIKDIGAEGALGKEGKTSCDVGEYKNRFEIADKVLTETRAKLARNTKMTKDEIKKALATCVGASCGGCAYFGIHDCCDKIKRDARACIIEQEKEIERLKDDYAKLQEQFAQYQMASDKEIIAQVKQAKIDLLKELIDGYGRDYISPVGLEKYKVWRVLKEIIEQIEEEIEE